VYSLPDSGDQKQEGKDATNSRFKFFVQFCPWKLWTIHPHLTLDNKLNPTVLIRPSPHPFKTRNADALSSSRVLEAVVLCPSIIPDLNAAAVKAARAKPLSMAST
jgi:hypothetical protein